MKAYSLVIVVLAVVTVFFGFSGAVGPTSFFAQNALFLVCLGVSVFSLVNAIQGPSTR